jgi:hypothetical protein
LIGVIPDEHETANAIGRYGLKMLGQELPENGDHAGALEYFLAGRASLGAGSAHDAAPLPAGSLLDGYLNS